MIANIGGNRRPERLAIATQDPAKARAAVVTHLRDGVQLMLDAVVPEYPPPEDLGA